MGSEHNSCCSSRMHGAQGAGMGRASAMEKKTAAVIDQRPYHALI